MDLKEYLDHLNRGEKVEGGSEVHRFMHEASQEALRITSELNGSYHTPEEIRQLMSRLTGKEIDETFRMFPPFYTDCGKNITVGRDVFINSGCRFQDQGGITIGDGALVGASSCVTRDVPADALYLERAEQRIVEGYASRRLERLKRDEA